MLRFNGLDVVVVRPMQIRRTWRERLFTLPWRPLAPMKLVPSKLPDDACYIIGGCIYVNEAGYRNLCRNAPPRTGPVLVDRSA